MGIYLGQLPPAELARLKAELAETLIASFCYPRFYDYRTGTLRIRPVDRSRRQEVWLYLSSFDFTAWNRVDLLSPDFQYYIERLFIQFVQRNRSFFGEQGRKRLADVRMLISTCAATVTEDLRAHLTRQNKNKPPFGSPRPVPSWATTNVTGQPEPGWERIAQSTFLLQQQIQEWRGEIKGVPQLPTPGQTEVSRSQPPASPTPKRPARPKVANGSQQNHGSVIQATVQEGARNGAGNRNAVSVPAAKAIEPLYPPVQMPKPLKTPHVPVEASELAVLQTSPSERPEFPTVQQEQVKVAAPALPQAETPELASARGVPQPVVPPATTVATTQKEATVPAQIGEDVAIFEQLSHQLLLWLRVEVVQCELDISGQSAGQLLDLLRQQNRIDETHLQVVSNLLNLANRVMKNGYANLLDYKQAMMFYLMHTRSRRH